MGRGAGMAMDSTLAQALVVRRAPARPKTEAVAAPPQPDRPPLSLRPAGSGFQVNGAAAARARMRAEPPRPAGASFSPTPAPDGALAVTRASGTSFTPRVAAHPRRAEIEAHEEVHRGQFALAGTRPIGTTAQLEAEARGGSRRLMRGMGFTPSLAAPADAALAYQYASAGEHLNQFDAWLTEHTTYDGAAVDWPKMVGEMLASQHILDFADAGQKTAVELSTLYRYWSLLEIFQQELDNAEAATPAPVGAGLTVPTREQLEDTLFKDYLPALTAADFDPADVENVSDAFLEHWLGKLEALKFVPDGFDIQIYEPKPRTDEINDERTRVLDKWFAESVQDLMFQFMLDDFTRAIGGPHATVRGLPAILPGGYARSLTPEDWLKTLDIPQYKSRLVDHLTDTFMAHLGKDQSFRQLMRSEADEWSRYRSLASVHWIIAQQGMRLTSTANSLRNDPSDELEDGDWDVAAEPSLEFKRMTLVAKAAEDFYREIGPAFDNDEALVKVLERMIAAIAGIQKLGATWALALRLSKTITAFKERVEDQRRRTREAIEARVNVSYDTIAAGIKEMGKFVSNYLEKTWIPKLHEVALARITANVVVLRDRYENWDTYSKGQADTFDAQATALEDIVRGLKKGDYDKVTIDSETVEEKDTKKLSDTAAILRAEARRQRDPKESKKQKEKLKDALDGFEDVKARIKAKDENPLVYGRDVYLQARHELNLDTFPEYTTYGDIVFGRVTAAQNPFLSSLVINWEVVEKLDANLKNITILVGIGLLTVASLLAGPVVLAAGAAPWVGTAVGAVLFAVDAAVSVGMAWHDKNEAQALLNLVRLDLDHSVTGVSEEDAERALTFAWIGLALSVLAVGIGVGAAAVMRFAKGPAEAVGLSVRYFKLLREEPELFNSLRRIVRDPVAFDKMLNLAGDAKQLENLLHRMGGTLDVGRVGRILELTKDAAQTNRMLDITSNARTLERMLGEIKTFAGEEKAFANLLASTDDVPALLNVTRKSGDLKTAQGLIGAIPDVKRLSGILNAAGDVGTLQALTKRVGGFQKAAALLEQVGVGNGPRLLKILNLPGAATLSDDAALALTRLDDAAIDGLRAASTADLEDYGSIIRGLEGANIRVGDLFKGPTRFKAFADEFAKFSEGERMLALHFANGRPSAKVLSEAAKVRKELQAAAKAIDASEADVQAALEAGTRGKLRDLAKKTFREGGRYQHVIMESVLDENATQFASMRRSAKAFAPDAIIGAERGGPFIADAAIGGDPDLASKIVRIQKADRGVMAADMRAQVEAMINDPVNPKTKFAFTDVYFSGSQVRQIQGDVIEPLAARYPKCEFRGFWMREKMGFEKLEATGGRVTIPNPEYRAAKSAGTAAPGNVSNKPFDVRFAVGDDTSWVDEVKKAGGASTAEPIYIMKRDGSLQVVKPLPSDHTTRDLVIRLLNERGG